MNACPHCQKEWHEHVGVIPMCKAVQLAIRELQLMAADNRWSRAKARKALAAIGRIIGTKGLAEVAETKALEFKGPPPADPEARIRRRARYRKL